jgi:uncharacterized membrane protein HdeD (DUF308 family)
MSNNNEDFPTGEILLVTITYGGILAITASPLSRQWSGIASLIVFYLIFLAPIIMGVIAYINRKFRNKENCRKWMFYAGALYFIIAPITWSLLVLFEQYIQKA